MPNNDSRTSSMLQRIPVILAVTAASYGLQVPQQAARWNGTGAPATARAGILSAPRLAMLPSAPEHLARQA